MKASEKILKSCNKYSGKSWWKIIEHFIFIFIIFLFFFACIPVIGIAFSIENIIKISGHKLVLYNGFINLNPIIFLIFIIMFFFFWLPSFKIWESARKFGKNLYYHGKTLPREKNGEYIDPMGIWKEFPPES
ncbi:MAG: hypothetical protein WAV23_02290 [Minisyncoccia bacterium]